ncbi:hypothetical protein AAHB43_00805 [Staphylococcus pseudintermedius]
MILTGMGIGACFSLCMTMFSIRSKTTAGSMALSGFWSVGRLLDRGDRAFSTWYGT